ncbi:MULTISPECIES: stage V sporulation protein AD [Alteribacter]|uniref:Stage V sporulation protein AD n=1 Tax=Alteribacter keqinensis TaxID=2483800 RepID=A0A3M7TU61_9BACI|nr:stage V sporulation protein AD [Alteribacter keqinensis]MBM7094737.1 stage V sporulation protein AD [Alteribacter salitolerans]RNA69067.1 stage V sporulation protein AD [Alteribacter keqinensis]
MKDIKQTWVFDSPVYIESCASVSGPMEKSGPVGRFLDKSFEDLYCGESTWEKAERALMKEAVSLCLSKESIQKEEVGLFIAGDLLNQNVTSHYTAREYPWPYLGMFSACATSMEGIAIASMCVHSGMVQRSLTAVSSHYGAVERQFRLPLEHVKQRPKTAMRTVTGAGAAVISGKKSPIAVRSVTIGKVVDWGLRDPLDMGQAMAPAAFDTLKKHLNDTGKTEEDYDLIITGDLSMFGSRQFLELCEEDGLYITDRYLDGGNTVYGYHPEGYAGGSGAGCSALVLYGYVFRRMRKEHWKKVLCIATGALFNPLTIRQKETIPCIAHAVEFELTAGLEE